MENVEISVQEIKNSDSPFTELFTLLICLDSERNDTSSSGYDSSQLTVASVHAENAIEVLLKGIHDIGRLMGGVPASMSVELADLGLLISYLANLTEALNSLRSNIVYALQAQHIACV